MTTGNRLPNYQRQIAELQTEIRKLWTALAQRPAPLLQQGVMPYSWAGFVAGIKTSGPWQAPGPLTLTSISLGYAEASTANTVVDLLVNGASVQSFTLAAGQTRYVELFTTQVGYAAPVQVRVDASGGDGSGFTVLVGYVREGGT